MSKPRILCVDDEPLVLAALGRHLARHFELEKAEDPAQALASVQARTEPYAVVVSDYNMPGMNGIEFLTAVRRAAPDTVRVMLTGQGDLGVAMQAVNEGSVFRFLAKPCPPEALIETVTAAARQHQLVIAERELLQKTLSGSLKMLTDILSLTSPVAFGRASRVYRIVQQIAGRVFGPEQAWEGLVAAMLCQVGCVAVPSDILERAYRRQPLAPHEREMYESHPTVARDLLSSIPRLERVAEAIAYQSKNYDGTGYPVDDRAGEAIPLAARVLRVALDYDDMITAGELPNAALRKLRLDAGKYDTGIVVSLAAVSSGRAAYIERTASVAELRPDMVLAEDVESPDGLLLVVKGQETSPAMQARLAKLVAGRHVPDSFRVLVHPDADSA